MNILLEYQGVKEKNPQNIFRRNQTKEVKQETLKWEYWKYCKKHNGYAHLVSQHMEDWVRKIIS